MYLVTGYALAQVDKEQQNLVKGVERMDSLRFLVATFINKGVLFNARIVNAPIIVYSISMLVWRFGTRNIGLVYPTSWAVLGIFVTLTFVTRPGRILALRNLRLVLFVICAHPLLALLVFCFKVLVSLFIRGTFRFTLVCLVLLDLLRHKNSRAEDN